MCSTRIHSFSCTCSSSSFSSVCGWLVHEALGAGRDVDVELVAFHRRQRARAVEALGVLEQLLGVVLSLVPVLDVLALHAALLQRRVHRRRGDEVHACRLYLGLHRHFADASLSFQPVRPGHRGYHAVSPEVVSAVQEVARVGQYELLVVVARTACRLGVQDRGHHARRALSEF
jgi:hypothetical protein